MQTISKSIYLGLGRAGICAVNHTLKQYEVYFEMGNIPPQIAFLHAESPESANLESLMQAFKEAMKQVSTPVSVACGYEVLSSPMVNVCIVGLLSESGCAAWMLELATKIKEMFGSCINLYGYGLLTSDSKEEQQTAYQSVVLLNGDHSSMNPTFEAFYIIEDKMNGAYPILDLATICSSVGLGMQLQGSLMSGPIMRILDGSPWKSGVYNIGDKVGWMHAIGVCQLVYDSEKLIRLYSLNVSEDLIGKLLDEDAAKQDPKMVPATMDLQEVIDSISRVGQARALHFAADNPTGIRHQLYEYLNSWESLLNKMFIDVASKKWSLSLSLSIDDILRTKGGLPKAQSFLDAVLVLCENLKQSVADEVSVFTLMVNSSHQKLEQLLKEYEAAASRIFRRKSVMTRILEDLSDVAAHHQSLKASLELRSIAERLLAGFISEVITIKESLKELSSALMAKLLDSRAEIHRIMTGASNSLINEFDISLYDSSALSYVPGEVNLSQYFDSENLMITTMSADDLHASMCRYAESQPRCRVYRHRLITDIIDEMDDETYMRMKGELEQRTRPLLRLNSKGFMTDRCLPASENAVGFLFIAMYAEAEMKSRLLEDSCVSTCRSLEFLSSNHPSLKQKMIFYRTDIAYIPYCLEALDGVVSCEMDALRPLI